MKKTLLILLTLILSVFGFGQQSYRGKNVQPVAKNKKELSEHERYEKLLAELDGTFQVVLADENKKPLFSESLLLRIKDARLYNQSVYLEIEKGISVFVPSQIEISSGSFVKLDKVVYQLKKVGYDEK